MPTPRPPAILSPAVMWLARGWRKQDFSPIDRGQGGRMSVANYKGRTRYSRLMPISVGVMCENCERVYFMAHPDTAKRIRVTGRPDPNPPYELKCFCRAVRGFDGTKT